MKAVICLVVPVLAFAVSSAEANLIAFWPHDESSGLLIDATNSHPPGMPNPAGTPMYGQPGVPNGTYGAINVTSARGTSIEYGPTGEMDFFTLGLDNNNPVMNLDATGAFTVMGWVNPLQSTVTGTTFRFLSTGSAGGSDRGWGIGLRLPNTAGTGASIRFTSYGILDNDSSTFDITYGTWIHMAATYNNGTINYFLNGNALDSDTSVFGNETGNGRLVIGGRFGGNQVDQMNGRIDGVEVYNQILTPAQIQQAAVGSVSVPEPSSALLALFGALGLARWRR